MNDALIDKILLALADEDQITKRLSSWEQDFVESVTARWDQVGELTEKQQHVLERIYAEHTA